MHALCELPHVIDVRNLGLAAAVELAPRDGEVSKRGLDVFQHCFDHGVMVRYTGDTIAVGPACTASEDDIQQIVGTFAAALLAVS